MKINIVSSTKPLSKEVHEELTSRLVSFGHELNTKNPELVIAIGGDGTVLKAVHEYVEHVDQCLFLGIHTGNLGFYADYLVSELDLLVDHINENDFELVEFPLLEVKLCSDTDCSYYHALNEITIVNALRTLKTDLLINGEFLEKFYGTGICISTPSGSTGYNKSLGGAVIHPDIKAYQITEMASINNNSYRTLGSPIILDEKHVSQFRFEEFGDVMITVDHLHKKIEDVDMIECQLSKKTVKFARAKSIHFFTRVKRAFL